jgi:hypothetical protein
MLVKGICDEAALLMKRYDGTKKVQVQMEKGSIRDVKTIP